MDHHTSARHAGQGKVHARISQYLQKFDFYLSKVEQLFFIIACVLLIVALCTVSFNVLSRYFFGMNLTWSIELNEYIMLYIAFLTASWVLKKEGHVEVDIVTSQFSVKKRNIFILITSIIASIACLVIFWGSLKTTVDLFQSDTLINNVMGIHKYIPVLIIPVGSLMLFLRLVHKIGTLLFENTANEYS